MNFTGESRIRLHTRNEGKLKSYQSCDDIRAWSHDVRVRDRYLREWIRNDMPFCVIPVYTLTSLLNDMTCKSRGRVTPRCHPNCRSKAVLESICASCHVIKECLKSDEKFQKYFLEEEFETTHWPCERCLSALKSIKMFWKIIVEKIFHVKWSKNEKTEEVLCNRVNNVPTVAKVWQNDMIKQAMFVKSIITLAENCPWKCPQRQRSSQSYKTKGSEYSHRIYRPRISNSPIKQQCARSSRSYNIPRSDEIKTSDRFGRKVNRCTSFKAKFVNVGCDACDIKKENDEVKVYRKNVEKLQEDMFVQKRELEKLRKENTSLKLELQNVYKSFSRGLPSCTPGIMRSGNDDINLIPKPFENCDDDNSDIRDIDSEMIITMKNCRSNNFKHVSLLQVLHKTNEPIINNKNIAGACCKEENPIDLLTKVQNTFGAIVRREMSIANGRRYCSRKSDIKATCYGVNICRSEPSCCTITSISSST